MSAAPDAPEGYSLHAGALAEDREAVLEVWRGNLGRASLLEAKYEWFYQRCPFGAPLVRILRHAGSDAAVGVAAAGPRRMSLAGRPVSAGLLVDLAVVPAHRSLGPAMLLQKALMSAGLQRFGLLYGFPNPRAAAVFRRVGYREVTQLVRYVRVLRSGDYLAARLPRALKAVLPRVLLRRVGDIADRLVQQLRRARTAPHARCEWQEQPWASIDTVWQRRQEPDGLVTIRDSAFVRWRLADAPQSRVRFLVALDRATGDPEAWIGCEAVDGVMIVRDFWSIDGIGGRMAALLDSLAGQARAAGCGSMSLEFQGAPAATAAIRRAGFVARTARPVYAIASAESAVSPESVRWHMTSADEDE